MLVGKDEDERMALIYEVWDTQTANKIGAFSSEAGARSLLADVLRVNGPTVAREMTVLAYDPDSRTPRDRHLRAALRLRFARRLVAVKDAACLADQALDRLGKGWVARLLEM